MCMFSTPSIKTQPTVPPQPQPELDAMETQEDNGTNGGKTRKTSGTRRLQIPLGMSGSGATSGVGIPT